MSTSIAESCRFNTTLELSVLCPNVPKEYLEKIQKIISTLAETSTRLLFDEKSNAYMATNLNLVYYTERYELRSLSPSRIDQKFIRDSTNIQDILKKSGVIVNLRINQNQKFEKNNVYWDVMSWWDVEKYNIYWNVEEYINWARIEKDSALLPFIINKV